MKHKKLLSLLVLLVAAATGAWADSYFYLDNINMSDMSATLMYGECDPDDPYYDKPYLDRSRWSYGSRFEQNYGTRFDNFRSTLKTITVDASCQNFTGEELYWLFGQCPSLTAINNLENLNISGLTKMGALFRGDVALTSLDLSCWDTSNITVMDYIFYGCSSLETIDISSWNTSSVTNMQAIFKDCSSLTDIYVGDGWSTANVPDDWRSNTMFDGCTSLPNWDGTKDKSKAHTGDGGYLKVKGAEPTDPAGSDVEVTTNAAEGETTFTEASFVMPAFEATVSYEAVRDMAVSVATEMSATRYLIRKEGEKFVPADPTALTLTVSDNLSGTAVAMTSGTDYQIELQRQGETEGQWTATDQDHLCVGNFRFAVTGQGEYDGTIFTSVFALYQKHITKQPVAKTGLVYTGEPLVLIEAAECEGGEMRYSTDGQTWKADLPTGTEAGTYTVYYKVVADENDDDPEYETLEGIVIGQAETDLAYENADGLFATVDDPFTVPTLTNPHSLTVSYSGSDANIATVDPESGEVTAVSAGEVTVTASFAGDRNYLEGSAQYTLTVTDKRTLRANLTDATTFYNGIKDNDYYAAINAAISEAIGAAETVNGNTTATQAVIDQASDDIAAAYQQALVDKEIRDRLIVECTTPELTAAPGEEIELKINISSGVAPFTVSWTDTKGKPVGEAIETRVMNDEIVFTDVAKRSGTYTVTVIDDQQKEFTFESQLTVEGSPLAATFENLLDDEDSYWDGSDGSGSFISGGYRFDNTYKEYEYGDYYYGFAYSNRTSSDFTTYAADRFNSCAGGGAEDTPGFSVFKMDRSYPMGVEVFGSDDGEDVTGFYITNAASTYEAMQNGTDLARQFGKGDWLKVTVTGFDAEGEETGTVDFYLADFRDPNAAYIIETWRWVDLTELGKVKRLVFTMSSSDTNQWGAMNTPSYFCMDNLGGEKPEHEEPLQTSICLLEVQRSAEPVAIFNVNGMQLPELRPGINIVKYADGTTKKILMK